MSDYFKKYYEENKEYLRRRHRELYYEIKREVLDAYGGKCKDCNLAVTEYLTLFFEDGSGGEFMKKNEINGAYEKYRLLRDMGFPQKLSIIVLCKRCLYKRRKRKTAGQKWKVMKINKVINGSDKK